MRKVALLLTVSLMLPLAAVAQDSAKPVKIGIINMGRLTLESKIGSASQSRVDKFVKDKINELQQENDTLQREIQTLDSQKDVLTEEAFTTKRNDLQQRALTLDQKKKDADRALQRIQSEEAQKFIKQASPIIQSIGKELNLSLIIDSTPSRNPGLIWFDDTLDITDMVIKRLDAATQSTTQN